MHSKQVWSLNNDITTSLRLRHTPIFLNSTPDLHRRNSVRVDPFAHPQHISRGSGPEFSSSFFFWWEAKFFEALGRTKNRQTVNNTRLFFDILIITLPNACHFDGNPQPRWEIRLKIGNRHRMLNLFQHAVTIAFFVFFAALALLRK